MSVAYGEKNQPINAHMWSKRPLRSGQVWPAMAFVAFFVSLQLVHSFPAALVAPDGVDCNACNLLVDSFDPNDPAKSTNGQYDSTKAGDAGNIVAALGVTNSFPVGSALIFGHLYATSNSPVNLGTNGGIGTHNWLSLNTGIEPGYLRSDTPSFPLPDTTAPYTNGPPPEGPTDAVVQGNTYHFDHVLHDGDYFTTNFDGATLVMGTARLVLSDGLNLDGNRWVDIKKGASLVVYAPGTNFVISLGGVLNETGKARNCVLLAATSVTSLKLSEFIPFDGVIIATNAQASLIGAGSSPGDIAGLFVFKGLKLYGNFRIHFDESLSEAARLQVATSPSVNDGQFTCQIAGFPGLPYVVQSSRDLISWTSFTTNRAPFEFTEGMDDHAARRFYRAIYTP